MIKEQIIILAAISINISIKSPTATRPVIQFLSSLDRKPSKCLQNAAKSTKELKNELSDCQFSRQTSGYMEYVPIQNISSTVSSLQNER